MVSSPNLSKIGELKWKVRECYLKRKMKQFISDDIYNELLKEPDHLLPRLSYITILFSDIRGFTQLFITSLA